MTTKLPFDAELLLSKVQEHETANRAKTDSIAKLAEQLLEAARKLGDSWSGSCMGYHCELYYGDFEKPPLEDRFNVEWGGTRGLPNGWRPREAEDVKRRIESLANSEFSLLEQNDKELTHSLEEFRTEIAIELTPLRSLPNLADEKELLRRIDALEWGDKAHKEYCASAVRSSPHSTRNSSAIMEGFRLPAHTYYEAVAHQGLKHCEAAHEFWKIAKRLLKQLQALQNLDSTEVSRGSSLDLVKLICTRFHLASKQLLSRQMTDRRSKFTMNMTFKTFFTVFCVSISTTSGRRNGHPHMAAGRPGWISY